jgi:hypothetical protein
VAEHSDSLTDFGGNMREWLHEIRRFSSRREVRESIESEPVKLRDRFPEGQVADAWLAAYAEHVASRIKCDPPDWAFDTSRVAEKPWFADTLSSPISRALALAQSPLAFKRRNLYTPSVDLPLRLRAGRPTKSLDEKRKANALRQRRFRARRGAELEKLRSLLAR